MPTKESLPDQGKIFEALGMEFSRNGSDEIRGECLWCGGEKFYLNVTSGQYDCKQCKAKGNTTTFLTRFHGDALQKTTADQYTRLKEKRGIANQTLKNHGLAWVPSLKCWLIPIKNAKGNVVNILRYYPEREKPDKFLLPGLPAGLFGFDRLAAADKSKIVLMCEGPFDLFALDYSLKQNRSKYVIVAVPVQFKKEWAEPFRDKKVRFFGDNDDGGLEHTAAVQKWVGPAASELLVLRWPAGTPDGFDVNDLVKDRKDQADPNVLGWLIEHSVKFIREPKLCWEHGWECGDTPDEKIEWICPNRLRTKTYVSLSGRRGTLKSTLMREAIAAFTQGRPMFGLGQDQMGIPAGHVIYITAEDSQGDAWSSFKLAGANKDLITILPAVLRDGGQMNILEHLPELRDKIRELKSRLVIIDGQNSVVGAPCIATDMLARFNVTNKLHQFAQQENICLVGIRNEDDKGRALGPQSMSDLGRCILRCIELDPLDNQRYFKLIFERISDAAPSSYPPIPYSVEDLGGSSRKILWGKVRPTPTVNQLLANQAQEVGA
jgi:AAA domain